MKNLHIILVIGLFISIASCNGNNKQHEAFNDYQREMGAKTDGVFDEMESNELMVYYFHATRRCATCNAVEQVTRETIKTHFANEVTFESINREEDENKALVEKYKVNGQTLLIIKGDKIVNLTNDAFLNARSNPEKFAEKLQKTIASLIN